MTDIHSVLTFWGVIDDIMQQRHCFLNEGDGALSSQATVAMVKEQIYPQNESRWLGWRLTEPTPAFSTHGFGHTGFIGTSLWIDPDRELIVVLLTHRFYHGRDGDAIAHFRIRLHEAVAVVIDNLSEIVQ